MAIDYLPPFAPSSEVSTRVLRSALAFGGEWAELFWERQRFAKLLLDDGRLEEATSGTEEGAGIRILAEGRTLYAHGSAIDADDLETLAVSAAEAVGGERTHDAATLVVVVAASHSEVMIDPRHVPIERKVRLLKRANAEARGHDKRIVQVSVAYTESVQDVVVAASDGRYATDHRVRLVLALTVVAKNANFTQTGHDVIGGTVGFEQMSDEAVAKVARAAASRAILNLEADSAPAGTFMVVISSEAGGTLIHEAVGHSLEADINDQEISAYGGKVGQRIASELITVVDDSSMPAHLGSSAIDDEGTPTRKNIVLERGVLRGYLSDREHAMKMGNALTGNGRRQSFRHLPMPRMTNTYIVPGDSDPQAIVRSVRDGLFVRRMGGGQVDAVSGQFAFDVSEGYRIKDGRVAGAIRGATLTGHAPTIMRSIDMVGNDLGFSIGTCGKRGQGISVSNGQPTIRIPAIVVGGIVEQAAPR